MAATAASWTRDHEQRVRRPRRLVAQPGLEREERDRARRVLRARVVAIEKRLPLVREDRDVEVDRDVRRDVPPDERDVVAGREDQQRQEAQLLLPPPGQDERGAGNRGLRDQPCVVSASRLHTPDLEQHDKDRARWRAPRLAPGDGSRALFQKLPVHALVRPGRALPAERLARSRGRPCGMSQQA